MVLVETIAVRQTPIERCYFDWLEIHVRHQPTGRCLWPEHQASREGLPNLGRRLHLKEVFASRRHQTRSPRTSNTFIFPRPLKRIQQLRNIVVTMPSLAPCRDAPIQNPRRTTSTEASAHLAGLIMWLPRRNRLPDHPELPEGCYQHPVVILSEQPSATGDVVVLIVRLKTRPSTWCCRTGQSAYMYPNV
jgi:hypothetical protein